MRNAPLSTRLTVLLIPVIILIVCLETVDASDSQDKIKELCSIISSTDKEYYTEIGKLAYTNQEENLKIIKQNKKQKLKNLLGDGVIDGWKGTLYVRVGEGYAKIRVAFPCNTNYDLSDNYSIWLHNDYGITEELSVKEGTPLHEALRKFKSGDVVFITGKLIPDLESKYGYRSSIIIDNGFGLDCIFEGFGQTTDESRR